MDVEMPELDGERATQEIRRLPRPACDVPIIGLTAHAMTGARERYLAAGMTDYVTKPVTGPVLLAKIAARFGDATPPESPASPPPAAGDAALDPEVLDALARALPAAKVAGLVRLYLEQTEQALDRVEARASEVNLSGLAREAHNLAGAAGNVGAVRVTETARALEAACKTADRDLAARLVGDLYRIAADTDQALRHWLDARALAATD